MESVTKSDTGFCASCERPFATKAKALEVGEDMLRKEEVAVVEVGCS